MLLRRIARPMFASWFVLEGLDVVRHPAPHAALAGAALATCRDTMATRCSGRSGAAPEGGHSGHSRGSRRGSCCATGSGCTPPSSSQLVLGTRLHGAAIVGTALMLALGRAPRTAALTLAALLVPTVAANLPVPALAAADAASPADRRRRLVQMVCLVGGAVLAGIDNEGRPGLSWRVARSRERLEETARQRAAHIPGLSHTTAG